MEHVAEQTPYTFDFARVDPDVWNHASEMSRPQNDRLWIDPTPLIPVFEQATQPRGYMLNRDTPQPMPEPLTLAERLAGRLKDLRAEQLNTPPLTPEAGHTHSGPSYGR
ncbi:hypothetical protein GCM10009860_13500 [Microbacterium mitrae]|uniref:hypothetical protein n=1 Tax=Microbacterium mitrae TaxID=664640 RepID=UPI00164EE80A|nr:hypothetical protein [Microbacterium mitrae]